MFRTAELKQEYLQRDFREKEKGLIVGKERRS